MDYLDPSIPLLVKTARAVLGWSQSDLAERAGVSYNTIGTIERWESTSKASTVKKVVDAIELAGVDVSIEPDGFGWSISGVPARRLREASRAAQVNMGQGDERRVAAKQVRVRKSRIDVESVLESSDA